MKFYEVLSNSMTLQNIVKPKILRKIKMRKKLKIQMLKNLKIAENIMG